MTLPMTPSMAGRRLRPAPLGESCYWKISPPADPSAFSSSINISSPVRILCAAFINPIGTIMIFRSRKPLIALIISLHFLVSLPAQADLVTGQFEAALDAPHVISVFNDVYYNSNYAPPQKDSPTTPHPIPYAALLNDNPRIAGTFSYDTAASPSNSNPFRVAYPGISLHTSLSMGDQPPLVLEDTAPIVAVFNDNPVIGDSVEVFANSANRPQLDLPNPTPSTFVFDLMDDENFVATYSNLPNLESLPVRLTEPSVIPLFAFSVIVRDQFGNALPSFALPPAINIASFPPGPSRPNILLMQYWYDLAIAVDPSDYQNSADFELASQYVSNNIQRIEVSKVLNAPLVRINANRDIAGNNETSPVLPTRGNEEAFEFDTNVDGPMSTLWYDPPIAVGYEYEILEGPNFFSVQVPTTATVPQTGDYRVEIFHGSAYSLAALLAPGESYAFPNGGASQFRIMGIDPSLSLNPDDDMAFPTGLSFVSSGAVRFTMSLIAVPEPAAAILAILGLAILQPRFRPRA